MCGFPETMAPTSRYRFAGYELDLAAYELRRDGRPVRLERQPMDLLILLVERRGELVTRADIAARLWGEGVFVDVETGVNTAVRKVRQALRDAPESPAFVETVQGKGYRFIAAVEAPPIGDARPAEGPAPAAMESPPPPDARPAGPGWRAHVAPAAVLAVAVLVPLAAWWSTRGHLSSSSVTLAVLPFENLSQDRDRDYLADGLTEETIAAVGQVDPSHVRVIGRTSTLAYKRSGRPLADMQKDLGLDYVVESSIRTEGARVRVTSKLIRLREEAQVWAASYDVEPTRVLEMQRELSAAIAEQVRLRVSPERLRALARRQSRDPQAYDLYLRGRYFWGQLTPSTTREAIRHFERATELDPGYALAWSGIADAWVSSPINGDAAPREVLPRARAAAEKAVAADAELAESQTSLAMVELWDRFDLAGAETRLRRATALDPAYELGQRMLGVVLAHGNRPAEAQRALRRARELEPLVPMTHALSAHVAYLSGNPAEANTFARQAIVVDPQFWIGHFQLAQAAEAAGEPDLALRELTEAARLSGDNSKALSLRGYVLARNHRGAEAREVLAALAAAGRDRYVPPYASALVHLGLGERQAALEWLERAWEARDVHLLYLPVDPKWDPLRADPRFQALLVRCGFVAPAVAGRAAS
jgi:TolB-like protein/DNA-binding winged helix-turn-helix (wHTH) protein/Flp pilus assembly protein TadD